MSEQAISFGVLADGVQALSGGALRRSVAEHVLGYHVECVRPDWYKHPVFLFFDPEFPPHVTYSWDEDACNALMYRNGKDSSDGTAPPLPAWESEGSEGAEYQVIEEMIGKGYHYRLYGYDVTHRGEEAKREYTAEFMPRGSNHEERYIATGEYPQLAICRAAVMASLGNIKPKPALAAPSPAVKE